MIKKAERPLSRQPGYLKRPVAFRPCLTAGLAFSFAENEPPFLKNQKHKYEKQYTL
jgi:hypothetical protein